jgi:hypothetical protein
MRMAHHLLSHGFAILKSLQAKHLFICHQASQPSMCVPVHLSILQAICEFQNWNVIDMGPEKSSDEQVWIPRVRNDWSQKWVGKFQCH